ncbi:MAG: large conductance mechanosensitive channel protein MscL [Gemmatimonadota bacterium]|jgi:large conductance mechanosensitive channel|nr:large conductance mechanosensitive channel protein MscL [Gemmatimonadota bacterium]
MFSEFRKFIARGNVIDLAVGIVIGAAFTSVVNSFVNDILMPPIGLLTGGVDFSNLFINLSSEHYPSVASAAAAGAPTLNYGAFINAVISFGIVAFAVFLLVQAYNRMREAPAPKNPREKNCPYCQLPIPTLATRCGHCTSMLEQSA